LSFEDAFELFNEYKKSYIPGTATREDQIRFREALLNPVFGSRVHILANSKDRKRYIVLAPDNVDLDFFIKKYLLQMKMTLLIIGYVSTEIQYQT